MIASLIAIALTAPGGPSTSTLVDRWVVRRAIDGDNLIQYKGLVYGTTLTNHDSWTTVFCLDPKTGKQLHTVLSGKSGGTTLTLSDGVLYAVNSSAQPGGNSSRVTAIDPVNWKVKWMGQYPALYSPSMVSNGIIASTTDYRKVIGIDVRTRKTIWNATLPPHGSDTIQVMIPEGPRLIVFGVSCLWCLDISTGKLLWQREGIGDRDAFDVAPNRFATVDAGGALQLFDTKTGNVAWRNADCKPIGSIKIANSRIYVGTRDGQLLTYNLAGQRLSSEKLPAHIVSNLRLAPWDGHRFLARLPEKLIAFNVAGHVEWSSPNLDRGTPIWANGNLVTLANISQLSYTWRTASETQTTGEDDVHRAFVGLGPGIAITIPTAKNARVAFARQQATKWLDLSPSDRRSLLKMGQEAFNPLLNEVVYLSRLVTHVPQMEDSAWQDMTYLTDQVAAMATGTNTQSLINALWRIPQGPEANQGWGTGNGPADFYPRLVLLKRLSEIGSVDKIVPFYSHLNSIAGPKDAYYWEELLRMLPGFARSHSWQAVNLFKSLLTPPEKRDNGLYARYACMALAKIGEPHGVELVLRLQDRVLANGTVSDDEQMVAASIEAYLKFQPVVLPAAVDFGSHRQFLLRASGREIIAKSSRRPLKNEYGNAIMMGFKNLPGNSVRLTIDEDGSHPYPVDVEVRKINGHWLATAMKGNREFEPWP